MSALEFELSSPSASHVAPATKPSLAVLYFENLAKDPESEYFCEATEVDPNYALSRKQSDAPKALCARMPM